jgi:hypothetical protein
MGLDEFWSADLRSVYNVMEGRSDAEQYREREAWERARWTSATNLQPHLKQGKRLALRDLMVFPWEQPAKKHTAPDPEREAERKRRFEQWDLEIKKKHNGE